MKKKRTVLVIIITLAILLTAGISIAFYLDYQLNKVKKVDLPETPKELDITPEAAERDVSITNIALFGVDGNSTKYGRSDAIIILSIDKKHDKIKLMSILRDTYVNIEGYGMTKINHAYAYGGPILALKTINSNFDLDIEDYIATDFLGFKEIIDLLGGVEVFIKTYELSAMTTLLPEKSGTYNLNGEQALEYVRIRYQGKGDYERTDRQRTVLEAIINKINASNLSISESTKLIIELLPHSETSFTNMELIKQGTSIIKSGTKTVSSVRFPLMKHSEDRLISGIYYLVADLQKTADFMKKFIYDDEMPDME